MAKGELHNDTVGSGGEAYVRRAGEANTDDRFADAGKVENDVAQVRVPFRHIWFMASVGDPRLPLEGVGEVVVVGPAVVLVVQRLVARLAGPRRSCSVASPGCQEG